MPVADLAFLNMNTGFAVIYDPHTITGNTYLIRTTDGGETWEDFCPVERAGEISFIDDSTGFFVSGVNLNRTTNGGVS
jgi:photosystem II stability/assembly factor-like uncharacterized protein